MTLLLALAWRDALAVALAGYLTGNSVHAARTGRTVHFELTEFGPEPDPAAAEGASGDR